MSVTTAIALAQASKVLKSALEELGKIATGAIKDRWRRWKNERNVESLAKKARAITYVKTLWNVERETSLYAFYYPSQVQFSESTKKQIDSLSHLGTGQNYVIQGTVGQGKSIFLRYLYGQELRQATSTGRIPVFVELRRVNNTKSLKATLFDAFGRLGFEIDDALFRWYAESGRVILLLDAFDEIDQQFVPDALHELEGISAQYPALQMIVTSRPDAAIQNSSHFRVLKLAPLAPADHRPFLDRICKDANQATELFRAVSSSAVDIRGLLTTPLLMTLLVLLYKAQAFIPDTVAAFYEQLFDTLFRRHDRSKPGFTRERFTKLDDDQVKGLFEALCFQVRLSGKNVLSMEAFKSCLDGAKRATSISVDTWKFRDEIVKTT